MGSLCSALPRSALSCSCCVLHFADEESAFQSFQSPSPQSSYASNVQRRRPESVNEDGTNHRCITVQFLQSFTTQYEFITSTEDVHRQPPPPPPDDDHEEPSVRYLIERFLASNTKSLELFCGCWFGGRLDLFWHLIAGLAGG
ncbi:hypothetical protein IWX90DRAFT_413818 [Phyllosticta citrichinensis]|uniref:Uncharacterized protein n=1 Tax=Phyllosticta citrichinensis TaxID=1130410 RepID=A0ABR1XVN2_9PEZI